eukprot:GHRQ01025287.1.p1 GENE.GHRQ01025287.1~~GHRQ01025287.1.p1  ORF type:complete len:192 (-),score=51.41 GHRQ01025287.1:232-807(-)
MQLFFDCTAEHMLLPSNARTRSSAPVLLYVVQHMLRLAYMSAYSCCLRLLHTGMVVVAHTGIDTAEPQPQHLAHTHTRRSRPSATVCDTCSMVPHKTARGAAALERLKCFEGVPPPYDRVKRLVVPDALQVLRLQHGHRFCKLGALAQSVGWKHQDAVAELEAKRKTKATAFYAAKKKSLALKAKAAAQLA